MEQKEELIRQQLIKAKEKLDAANALLKDGFCDDTISRAYYCIFHSASAALLLDDITVESHSALKTMFGLHLIKTNKIDKRFGRYLNRLKDERENSDYDIYTTFEESDAKLAIQEATEFLNEIEQFVNSQLKKNKSKTHQNNTFGK